MALVNELYLTVLPAIHLTPNSIFGFGLTEQVLTLTPSEDFATVFFPDEVDGYIATFDNRANRYLTGGHVIKFECRKVVKHDGRVIVKVLQYVS
jgi:hypothetical protein